MIQSVDFYILKRIQHLHCRPLDFLMPKVSALGNLGAVWILFAFAMSLKKSSRGIGVIILASLAVGVILGNYVMKILIGRPRPCWIDYRTPLLIRTPTDYSFPSGHTLSSFIAAFILVFSGSALPLSIAAVALAAAIAFSRMYLYVHFPSDIFGSIMIAAVIAYTALYVAGM